MADFPDSPKPDYPIEEVVAAPIVLISTHRDGSEQRRLKGGGDGAVYMLRYGGQGMMTETERDALIEHYDGQDGTFSSFSWDHPETGDTLTVRYAEPPQCRLVGFNAWTVEIKLKVVPA